MDVSVEATAGLERRMTVEVPAERIEQEVQNRLKNLARKVKLDGFRPGKIPFKVVEQKFAGKVRKEVLAETIRSSFQEAVKQKKLRLAGDSKIETLYEQPGLGYTATFEVYPEITLSPLNALKLNTPTAEVTGGDVDKMLEVLRRQHQTWAPVEREARKGDRLEFGFSTSINGGEFKGDETKPGMLVLGSNTFPPDIEDQLLGAKAGEEVLVDHHFSASHQDPALANKPVRYAFKVISVSEPKLPELNEDFAKSLGVKAGTLDVLRAEVRDNMQRELSQAMHGKVKQAVMDALIEANPVDVPKALLDKEVERLMEDAKDKLAAQGVKAQDIGLQSSAFEETARRRVILGLLLSDIIKAQEIKVDPQRLRSRVEAFAATYEDPDEVIKWYYGSRERLGQIELLVLEDQVVEVILAQAQVSPSATTFDALMNPGPVANV